VILSGRDANVKDSILNQPTKGIDIVDSPVSFSGFGINPTPNDADCSLLGAQASRLHVFNQESFK
jgi:hypothetical protein